MSTVSTLEDIYIHSKQYKHMKIVSLSSRVVHINPEKKMKQIQEAQEGVGGAETEKLLKPKKGKKKFGIPAAQETA